jgi:hypothetical protein
LGLADFMRNTSPDMYRGHDGSHAGRRDLVLEARFAPGDASAQGVRVSDPTRDSVMRMNSSIYKLTVCRSNLGLR